MGTFCCDDMSDVRSVAEYLVRTFCCDDMSEVRSVAEYLVRTFYFLGFKVYSYEGKQTVV